MNNLQNTEIANSGDAHAREQLRAVAQAPMPYGLALARVLLDELTTNTGANEVRAAFAKHGKCATLNAVRACRVALDSIEATTEVTP